MSDNINDPIRMDSEYLRECTICGTRHRGDHTMSDCDSRIRRAEWRSDQREEQREALRESESE